MINYQDLLINAYSWTAGPVRSLQTWRMKSTGRLPLSVLFYHRVADSFPNGWTISRRRFAEHIDWLQANFELIGLEEVQNRIVTGHNDRPAVSITFDDGYAENSEFALPLLLERRIPCTYFVTYRNVHEQQPFAHDVALGQPLPVDSLESIRALAQVGVEIGNHTLSHRDCGQLNTQELIQEIEVAGQALQEALGQPIRYFAFPFGQPANLQAAGFALCQQLGYRGVCSAYGGFNSVGGDAFHLQRIHGDPSLARLRNWLSFSPRQLNIRRFEYRDAETSR